MCEGNAACGVNDDPEGVRQRGVGIGKMTTVPIERVRGQRLPCWGFLAFLAGGSRIDGGKGAALAGHLQLTSRILICTPTFSQQQQH